MSLGVVCSVAEVWRDGGLDLKLYPIELGEAMEAAYPGAVFSSPWVRCVELVNQLVSSLLCYLDYIANKATQLLLSSSHPLG